MDFPSDGVTLAGDLSPEDVARALETGGVKSWIYMNAESNPAFPKQAKATLGERFKTVIVDPSALTRGVADDVERAGAIFTIRFGERIAVESGDEIDARAAETEDSAGR